MGEAAEWEIWRRHGVDISDDGWCERSKRAHNPRHAIKKPGGYCMSAQPGHENNMHQRKYKVHVRRGRDNTHDLVVWAYNSGSRAGAFWLDRHGDATWMDLFAQKAHVKQLINGTLPEAKPGQAYRTAMGMVNNALAYHPDGGFDRLMYSDLTTTRAAAPQQPKARSHTMNTKEVIRLMQLQNGASIVACQYVDGTLPNHQTKTYHFLDAVKCAPDLGDLLVVESRDAFAVVRVVETKVPLHKLACGVDQLKHVVQRVDTGELDVCKDREGLATEKLALSEVNERLASYQRTLGGSFNAVQQALTGPLGWQGGQDDIDEPTFSRAQAKPRAPEWDDVVEDAGDGGSAK